MNKTTQTPNEPSSSAPARLIKRLNALNLTALQARWHELPNPIADWIPTLCDWEEQERKDRSLKRRLRAAKLGLFKDLSQFDWRWPEQIDQSTIRELMTLSFIDQATNVILLGPNGVGKSTIAKNIAYQAAIDGRTVLFTTAAQMLNDLAARDGDQALRRRLSYYAAPQLLVIDEVGYLSYGTRHADLLFEIVNRRYEARSTIVTTNKPFNQWNEVFPNAACVVSLVDRLIHHAEIIAIDGQSYRMHEAQLKAEQKRKQRRSPSSANKATRTTETPS